MNKNATGKIEVRNVRKSFGPLDALQNISLSIGAGEYCCLLGPSGCGKTTLLRMIAGHDTPTSGDILIDEISTPNLPNTQRRTAMMFQNYALFPHLTVLDNVAFALRMRGQSVKVRHTRAKELLEKVRLENLANRLPAQLSGGQQQRVALARALITDPKVLLLDEPLSALDEFLRLKMRSELRSIQKELGITFVHVTHSQMEAIGVADKVVVMDRGRIEQVGSPMEIYIRPRNAHVALFIGGQNVLSGKIAKILPSSMLMQSELRSSSISLPVGVGKRDYARGDNINISIRRDRIKLGKQVPNVEAKPNQLMGIIESCEYQGTYVKVTMHTEFGQEFVVYVADDVFIASEIGVDETVIASFTENDICVLEPDEPSENAVMSSA